MRLLVDSSVLIDHLRGCAGAVDVVRSASASGDELWTVTPVRTEVLAGMRPDEERRTRRLLDSMLWVDVDAELAELAAQLARPYIRSHPGIETVDMLVAAAAVRLGARLLTRNVRHFPMFEGLEPPYE